MGEAPRPLELEESSSEESSPTGPECINAGAVPAISNFSIQYNYTCASIATLIMVSHNDQTGPKVQPDFEEPLWAKEYLLDMVFAGSVVGMVFMGYLGDLVGISRALVLTNSLTVAGALASALLSWGEANAVWTVVAVSRFMLGAGVGGNYPLSAAKAAESTPTPKAAVDKAANAFFWQGPGSCAPYLVGLLVLLLPSSGYRTSLQFRLLLGFGAFPSLVILLASMNEDSRPPPPANSKGRELSSALTYRSYCLTVLGTAGTWLLFDVAFYGTVIFAPNIMKVVFGADLSLQGVALSMLLMTFVGILGTLAGVAAVRCIGPKLLASAGLAAGAVVYAGFAVVHWLMPSFHYTQFTLLLLLNFTMYAGPNVATYLLPVVSFPSSVRSTFHGVSSAAAKVGAMLGVVLFPVVKEHAGTGTVMVIQSLVCFAGAALCQFSLEHRVLDDADVDE